MPNREEINICAETLLLPTATVSTAQTSAALDTLGFGSAHFTLAAGATLAAGLTYKVTESDDDSTYTDADASAVIDTGAALTVSSAKRIAYVGGKRYAKLVVTPGGSSILTIMGHRGYAAQKPVANPI